MAISIHPSIHPIFVSNIPIYNDISGRLIYEKTIKVKDNNVIQIKPSELGISPCVYYINISSSECNIIKKYYMLVNIKGGEL
ncbi:MAG: hypothetical protein ACUVWP_01155 [bacterium]